MPWSQLINKWASPAFIVSVPNLIQSFQFVTSPLCCPSRSSILTGQYVHNHLARNNSVSGNCSSTDWQQGPEKHTFNTYVKNEGYRTFYGGKYLNQYGTAPVGGPQHVPPGWDAWYGLVGNSRYYNYTLSVNGKPEKHHADYKNDYLTDLLVSWKTLAYTATVSPILLSESSKTINVWKEKLDHDCNLFFYFFIFLPCLDPWYM